MRRNSGALQSAANRRGRDLFVGVVVGPGKMQRHVRLVADYPAIVARWAGGNVEQGAGAEFVDGAVVHRGGSAAGEDQADVFDIATRGADRGANMHGPAPARFVGGAA